ncbi:MAG TPA: acyl-CoA thioesterase [Dehalococcoidales bacterium]|nr:acyl-CoA thioesterase [Dehalococcoidales bacterium]
MEGKTVRNSAVILSQLMGPQDTNNAGNVHGGVIMRLIDSTASVVATRHARSTCVTASIDRLDFLYPVYAGDLVTFKASLNFVGTKSMEIGVRVETENLITGEIRHTASAYVTYVSLDKSGRPKILPPLISETAEEQRRNQDAKSRREVRLIERRKKE